MRYVSGASISLRFSHKSLYDCTIPRKEHHSFTFWGGLIAIMAFIFLDCGFIPCLVKTYPRHLHLSMPNVDFVQFTFKPDLCNFLKLSLILLNDL